MKKLKLLHITRPTEYGIYRFLVDLIKYTSKDKFDITVACPKKGPLPGTLKESGIKVIPLEIERNISPLRDLKSFFAVIRLLKKEKWDILHTHCSKAGFFGRIAAKFTRIPAVIYTPNSWYFDEPLPAAKKSFYIFLEKLAALFGGTVVAVTEAERKEIVGKGIVPQDRITTIYDGIDTGFLKEGEGAAELKRRYAISPADKLVGMIARLVTQKSPLDFIRAAAIVSNAVPEARFIIVGDGPLKEDVKALSEKLGIAGRLILAGACHEARDINKFINLLDISVLTSCYEGLPLIALQSMYLKKPLVMTNVRGAGEVIKNNKNGIIVPVSDVEAIAEAVIFLLKYEKTAKEIGEAGHQAVVEYFTAEKMAAGYERLYMEMLSKRRTKEQL